MPKSGRARAAGASWRTRPDCMNMNIEDQRAVNEAAGPAGSPCATFGPGPQSCHPGVMPLQDGASQFNLLKPVKGCSSQFADKVPCIPPSTRDPGSTLLHPNGPHLQNGASQLSLLKPVKGCLSQFADKVHSLAPREVQPVAVPDTSSPQCQQIPPPDTSSQQVSPNTTDGGRKLRTHHRLRLLKRHWWRVVTAMRIGITLKVTISTTESRRPRNIPFWHTLCEQFPHGQEVSKIWPTRIHPYFYGWTAVVPPHLTQSNQKLMNPPPAPFAIIANMSALKSEISNVKWSY